MADNTYKKSLSIAVAESLEAPPPQYGVTYHEQNDQDSAMFCGAASAQMILESIGAGRIEQCVLYDECKSSSAKDLGKDWFSAPDGLASILNQRRPANFGGSFRLWDLQSEEAVSRKVCWAIEQGVAPIVSVNGGRHWIVVVGFEASEAPKSSTDTHYEIIKFDVFDPALGSENREIFYRKENELEFSNWIENILDPVETGFWREQCLVICDPDWPPQIEAKAVVEGLPPTSPMIGDLVEIKGRATRDIPGILDFPLQPRNVALQGAQVGEPILVEREDVGSLPFYYLVPFYRGAGELSALMIVDAYEKGGRNEIVVSSDGTNLGRLLDREAVIQRFAGQEVEAGGHNVRLDAKDLYDHLVWRPSAESLTPYKPFYRFDVQTPDGEANVYVRIDGVLFTELHDDF